MFKTMMVSAALLAASAAAAVPAVWESDYGSAVVGGDDVNVGASFGFAFPFLGQSYSGGDVSTNGFVSLGGSNGQGCCNGSVGGLLSGAPRIATQWMDLVGTVYLNTAVAGRAVLTWTGGEYGVGGSFASQLQLFSDGRMVMGFDGPSVPAIHVALTGFSVGGGAADPGSSLADGSFSSSSLYQLFGPGTFSLNQSNLFFTPVDGGLRLSTTAPAGVPEPASWALLVGGFGLAGSAMRRRAAHRAVAA